LTTPRSQRPKAQANLSIRLRLVASLGFFTPAIGSLPTRLPTLRRLFASCALSADALALRRRKTAGSKPPRPARLPPQTESLVRAVRALPGSEPKLAALHELNDLGSQGIVWID